MLPVYALRTDKVGFACTYTGRWYQNRGDHNEFGPG
jgi:hypothetical protein